MAEDLKLRDALESRINWCFEVKADLDIANERLHFGVTDFRMLDEAGGGDDEFNAEELLKEVRELSGHVDAILEKTASYRERCTQELVNKFNDVRQERIDKLHHAFIVGREYRLYLNDEQKPTFTVLNVFGDGNKRYIVTAPDFKAHEVKEQNNGNRMEMATFNINDFVFLLTAQNLIHTEQEKKELGFNE